MLNQAPSHGKNQAEFFYIHPSAVDLKGAPADIITIPVIHDKIEILALGLHLVSSTGTVSTSPAVVLDKTLKGTATRAIVNAQATVTVTSDVTAPNDFQVSLDAAAVDAYSGALGKPAFPTAVKGDLLHLELLTAGVGGTQSARPYIIWRKRAV